MRQLIWKEWHELRILPLGAALLYFLLAFGYFLMCRLNIADMSMGSFSPQTLKGILWVTWVLFAILAGAGLFSQEIGTGTLSFLLSLPGSRGRIWMVKVATGLVAFALSALLAWLVCWLSLDATAGWWLHTSSMPGVDPLLTLGYDADTLLIALGCYVVSLAVSPLLDRYISAAMVSLVACLALAYMIVLANSGESYVNGQYRFDIAAYLSYMIVWLAIPVLLAISYWTFTRGESLRSPKRFFIAGRVAIIGLILVTVLFTLVRNYAIAQELKKPLPMVYDNPSPASKQTPSSVASNQEESSPLYLTLTRSDSGEPRWQLTLPLAHGPLVVKNQVLVDGVVTFTANRSVVSAFGQPYSGATTLYFSAAIDGTQDGLVKAVLGAQGIKIGHPNDVTFNVADNALGGALSVPVTLHFKTGYGSAMGNEDEENRVVHIGESFTLLDTILLDRSIQQSSESWQGLPDDPSFESHFAPGTVHRITIRVTISPTPPA